jgi:demethylmenaquinone methyltransferase/2-methoxy-6-polyprenyl-1,4-benzoquinol methylase
LIQCSFLFVALLVALAYIEILAPVGETVVLHATGDSNRFAQQLFAPLPGRYDVLAELLSLGQNGRWRRDLVGRIVPGKPTRVLDVATGTAGVAIQLASRTAADVVGADLTPNMLRQGQGRVTASGLSARVLLTAGRAEQLPFPDGAFDALSFTYLLRYVDDPLATLRELSRVVKPGAAVASLDFLAPPARFWYRWWWLFTRFVLPVAGLITGGRPWYRVGRFLGPNISEHYRKYPLSSIIEMWQQAGFDDIHVRLMSLGGGLVMSGTRRRD